MKFKNIFLPQMKQIDFESGEIGSETDFNQFHFYLFYEFLHVSISGNKLKQLKYGSNY